MADHDGNVVVVPDLVRARQVGSMGSDATPGGGGAPPAVTHYKLRAHRTSDDTWQTWDDTAVSLANAPGGSGNFDASTLTVEGTFTS